MSKRKYGFETVKLTVFNVPPEATQDEIEQHFGQYCHIHEVYIRDKPTGPKNLTNSHDYTNKFANKDSKFNKDQRHVFLHVDAKSAEEVITQTDQTDWMGKTIAVAYSRAYCKDGAANTSVRVSVTGIARDAKENLVRMKFSAFGLVQNFSFTRNRNECIAEFDMDANFAKYAERILDGATFYGKPLNVQVLHGEGGGFGGGGRNVSANGNAAGFGAAPLWNNFQVAASPMPAQQAPMANMFSSLQQTKQLMSPPDFSHVNAGGFDQAANPSTPTPASQSEVDQLIKERELLEAIHPYEQFLIGNYQDGNTDMPTQIPPVSYMHLLRDRAIIKTKLANAKAAGFSVYANTTANLESNIKGKYGF